MIAIRIGMVEKKPRNMTLPNTATASVTRKVTTVPTVTLSPTMQPVEAAEPASSRPISATTGPMAAGGSTTLIQSVPHL